MNYSSYLGSKKCNNVICRQGPTGPPGPSGESFNTFTIISSNGTQSDTTFPERIIWYIDIPFIYGRQFTFTFHTIGINVVPILLTPQPLAELTVSYSYIFGTGQSIYQSYYTTPNTINYGYIPYVNTYQGIDTDNFNITTSIDINGNIKYYFYYDNDSNNSNYTNLINSKIQLNGIKYY